MSKNIETLRQAHDAFSAGDHVRSASIIADRFEFTDHGRQLSAHSRAEFQGWLDDHKKMSSNMQLVDAVYIDGGDYVTARFRAVGVQDGATPMFPVSNREFSLDVCEVWKFNAEGQAIEAHNYADSLGLMIQLGHIQPPQL